MLEIRFIVLVILCKGIMFPAFSNDEDDPLKYVNPFIGTARSPIASNWDGNGGTYPGAVAPYGYIQLSPETGTGNNRGYNYENNFISFFSCIGHKSGYPSGSAGQIFVMPVNSTNQNHLNTSGRPFAHQNENAAPGYYRVVFSDDSTVVETTATQHTGMFRFTFSASVQPKIFVADVGNISLTKGNSLSGSKRNVVMEFNKNYLETVEVEGGILLSFPSKGWGKTIILLKISTSSVSTERSSRNIIAENNAWNFDQIKEKTQQKWRDALSAIEINDTDETSKTIFYTALYHSMLIPWITSDADGFYKGIDGSLYAAKGRNRYGSFSPWDTFRSLHPLLCLIAPGQQNDMILSMLDTYQQSGWLPTAPMTGNHAIPIIVDSYFKGITDFDTALAYSAMKKSLLGPQYFHKDMGIYDKLGYIPFTRAESVTKTVEYAYNDWVLAQFSRSVADQESDYTYLLNRSFNYRNLFHPAEMFLLPRNQEEYKLTPGSVGYKEGDKWIYSYFVPHNPQDLINLSGGTDAFVTRLDSAFSSNYIVFDNEPAFHIPYLFNYAGQPYKTQKWLSHIRTYFSDKEGGLPGNDDLGSLSSWYVFNAMGFYPVCPGKPVYAIGAPMFSSLTLNLGGDTKFVVKANNVSPKNCYISKVELNGIPYGKSWISHSTIMKGGEIVFEMDSIPNYLWAADRSSIPGSETLNTPGFHISKLSVSKNKVAPNEKFWVRFSIQNNGSTGTEIVKFYVNGKDYGHKNMLLDENTYRHDSIECRLYTTGEVLLSINESVEKCIVNVIDNKLDNQFEYHQLSLFPIVKLGDTQEITFKIKNIGGKNDTATINLVLNKEIIHTGQMILLPGEEKLFRHTYNPGRKGVYTLKVNTLKGDYKVYSTALEATIVDVSFQNNIKNNLIYDYSGLSNNGYIRSDKQGIIQSPKSFSFDESKYVEIVGERSGIETEKITMMAWVRPTHENRNLTALLTKGDNNVIQLHGNRSLTFFIGGWGRGECNADLPENWIDNWHHVAGVCDGKSLWVYIDGKLESSLQIGSSALPESKCNWNLGRNEEFPGERIFHGKIDKVKIFVEPLSEKEIGDIIKAERTYFK